MTMKVIYSECSIPFWIDVAEKMASDAGWEPCYWIASPEMEKLVWDRFPSIVFHSNLDAIRGIAPVNYASLTLSVLDQPLMEAMARCESLALKMMDRMDALDSFSYGERLRLYYRLLRYWVSVLDDLRPEMVIFSTIPHIVYDYVLYALCRHRGVKTTLFEFTKMRGLVFPLCTFEDETDVSREYRRLLANYQPGSVHLSEATERYLQSLTGSEKDLPAYIQPFYSALAHKPFQADPAAVAEPAPKARRHNLRVLAGVGRKLMAKARSSLAAPYRHFTAPPPRNYLKVEGKRPEESFISGFQYRLFRRRSIKRMRELAAHYANLAQPVDLSSPYVYVPLSYQPERTTSPLGGVFVNQLLMLEMLSVSLPQGWQLYVKEHPTHFFEGRAFRTQCARTADFYDDIAALPNVRLAPMSLSSFELTDHAQAVASVSGTAGWEAVTRGKPGLVFGYPWYQGCEGIFHTTTKESCVQALRQIESGYTVDPENLRLFIHALERVAFVGYVDGRFDTVAGISPEDNVEALTRGLKRFWGLSEEPKAQEPSCAKSV